MFWPVGGGIDEDAGSCPVHFYAVDPIQHNNAKLWHLHRKKSAFLLSLATKSKLEINICRHNIFTFKDSKFTAV